MFSTERTFARTMWVTAATCSSLWITLALLPSRRTIAALPSTSFNAYTPKSRGWGGAVQFPELPLRLVGLPGTEHLLLPNECYCSCTCKNRGIGTKKKSTVMPSLSAQSVAARERRKITEKTTKLGRLIPGGWKMTTAEMVRFLQAQIGVLQLVRPRVEYKPGITALVGSSHSREKFSEEKCLATKDLVIRSREGMLPDLEAAYNHC